VEKRNPSSVAWLYAVVLLIALAMFGVGLYWALRFNDRIMLAAGCLATVVVLATWPLAYCLTCVRRDSMQSQHDFITPVNDRLQQLSTQVNVVAERMLLSDRAKSVAYRDKDREALRRAIQEEMDKNDWDAALTLTNDMERAFGYKQEADRFREEINTRRQEAVRKQVGEAVAVVDRYCRAEQWNQAFREAERLMQIYPGSDQVQRLPQEIENRRQAHKKRLLDSWNEAVARHDVDGGIEILKQLDLYLTPQEAEALQETARGVFKDKLGKLRDQFAGAVRDNRWHEALRIGESIMRDFPNSRLAQEVRESMDALRQRAGEVAPAAT